jgi:hypothetical protein
MGYYSQFPRAIPRLRAGYVRVTHPCATNIYSEKHIPFDLHVLGLPLAFILSQDQTLHSMIFTLFSYFFIGI